MNEETNTSMEQESTISTLTSTAVSRRRFLAGSTALAGLAVFAAACGNDDDDTDSGAGGQTGGGNTPTTAANANADLDVAAAAAGLEKLATDTYAAALAAATAGKLGTVPPAVATYVTTAQKHHQEALDSWNRVLTAGGRQAVSVPTAALAPAVNAEFAKVTTIPGAATLALRLEDFASQTYQSVIPSLKSPDATKLAAQITVVGSQHQAILRYVLGLYPVGSGPGKAANGLANVDFAPANPQPALITG
jgi:hypothetical protein